MNAKVSKTIEAYETEFEVEAEFNYSETTTSESIEHFGFRGSHQEGETTFDGFDSGVTIKGNLPAGLDAELILKIEAHVESLKPEDLWDEEDCLSAIN